MWWMLLLMATGPRLETLWRTDLADHGFRRVPQAAAAPDGTLLVGDGYRLLWLGPDGKVRALAAEYGAAPGQFLKIDGLRYHTALERFTVYDQTRRMLVSFGRDGAFLGEVHLPERSRGPLLSTADEVLLRMVDGEREAVFRYDPLTEVRDPVLAFQDPSLVAVGVQISAGHKLLVAAYPSRDSLDVYSFPDLAPLRSFRPDPSLDPGQIYQRGRLETPEGVVHEERRFTLPIAAVQVDSNDRIWVFGHPTHPDLPLLKYHIYDAEGTLLHKGRLDDYPLALNGNRIYLPADRDRHHMTVKCVLLSDDAP